MDGALSLGPLAEGLSVGRGTDATGSALAPAAVLGLTTELPVPVIVIPTCSRPLLSRAEVVDQGSRQKTKANLHIVWLPARDQSSGFATVASRDRTILSSKRLAFTAQPKHSKNEASRLFTPTRAGFGQRPKLMPYWNVYGHAMGTSAGCRRSVVEFSGVNGAPVRIKLRTLM